MCHEETAERTGEPDNGTHGGSNREPAVEKGFGALADEDFATTVAQVRKQLGEEFVDRFEELFTE